MKGYLRADGKKGIRNITLVVYLVECAHHVARRIVNISGSDSVHLIGFPGCYPNEYALDMMKKLCTHPNVGGALLISLGCEGFNREILKKAINDSGRPVKSLVIQREGGTKSTIEKGKLYIQTIQSQSSKVDRVDIALSDLVVGTICGGSDGTSGITANPAVGRCFDTLVNKGAVCIFEETGELIGCEDTMCERAVTPELAHEIRLAMIKAAEYYTEMGYGSFAPGNAEGGLSTQEEKSMGAYCKSGDSPIYGLIKPGDQPTSSGLYLMDVVPDGGTKFGFPNISDNAEIVELIASGCHVILFTTGRGSVVGSAISPVIKICANPDTYERMRDDMDVNAGKVITDGVSIDALGDEITDLVEQVMNGLETKSEEMGHQEFILTYKQFEPTGPGCLPVKTN